MNDGRRSYFWLAAAILAVAVAALHGHAVWGWWRWDDPAHLLSVSTYSPAEFLLQPPVWREISSANFTPLLPLSYGLDLKLFGLWPAAFYVHHLLVLWFAALAAHALMCCWVRGRVALLASLVFVGGVPLVFVAQQLMVRHYLEGLLFAILSLLLFVRAMRSGRAGLLLPAALAYALAIMAKEVYVPLIALLPFLAEGRPRSRCVALLPFGLVLLGYVLWRGFMLAGTGGYGAPADFDVLAALRQLAAIPALLLGGGWPAVAALVALAVGFACWIRVTVADASLFSTRPGGGVARTLLTVGAAVGLVLLPLLPLTIHPGIVQADRYLLLPWLVAVVFAAVMLDRVSRRHHWLALVVCAVVVTGVGAGHLQVREQLREQIAEKEAHGRFVWGGDASQWLWMSDGVAAAAWDMLALGELKRSSLGGTSPRLVADEIQLVDAGADDFTVPGMSLWRYDPLCRCVRDVSDTAGALLRQWRSGRDAEPVDARVAVANGAVTWSFGPYPDGRYQVVGDRVGRIVLPAQGTIRTSMAFGEFRVRHDAVDGRIRYSAPLRVERNATDE